MNEGFATLNIYTLNTSFQYKHVLSRKSKRKESPATLPVFGFFALIPRVLLFRLIVSMIYLVPAHSNLLDLLPLFCFLRLSVPAPDSRILALEIKTKKFLRLDWERHEYCL
jgi:hypothetical protein